MKKTDFIDNYNKPFPTILRHLIKERKTTIKAVADYVGITRQAVSQYQDGSTQPNADTLIKISNYFNVSVDYLLGLAKQPTKNKELNEICEYTGLSQNAVEVLIHFDNDKRDILSKVIESGEFHDIIRLIAFAQIDKDILYPSGDYTAAIVVKKLNDFRNGAKKSHLEKIMERISQQVVGRGIEPFYKQLIIEDITTIFEKITGGEQ